MDTIVICLGSSCFARGNKTSLEAIQDFLAKHNLEDQVEFKGELCSQNCSIGPNMKICGCLHSDLNEQKVVQLLTQHFKK